MGRGCRILVSGVPRGLQQPRPDGNWLTDAHKAEITAACGSVRCEILEAPAAHIDRLNLDGVEVALVEGGNRIHYPGELDWSDYERIFVPSLRWVQLCSTGFSDNVTEEVRRGHASLGSTSPCRGASGGVMLTNAPGLHTTAIAESVLAGMLWHAKRLAMRRSNQSKRNWETLACVELAGRTVVIIGTGRIGRRVAELCKAFKMRTVGMNRSGCADGGPFDAVVDLPRLRGYLCGADFLVLALPLTAETRGLFDAAAIHALGSSAFLVNVGRGAVVDETALAQAVADGEIGGAYLDVFREEPLPATSPLWGMDNVLIVPHDSHSSPRIGDRVVRLFSANLGRYLRGERLEHLCDIARGY